MKTLRFSGKPVKKTRYIKTANNIPVISSNIQQYPPVIASNIQKDASFSYTKVFQDYFGSENEITDEFLKRQKEYFGFTLYILEKKSIWDALNYGLEIGKDAKKNHFQLLLHIGTIDQKLGKNYEITTTKI